jgi:poly-gamma-glutamate capsule biosynthesis protein CapA/YwtB (metallophosphatase superfamily)
MVIARRFRHAFFATAIIGMAASLSLGVMNSPGLATTTTTSSPSVITLSAVGDTDLGNTPQLPASPIGEFAPVRRFLTGDVVFGNLEGTMTTATTSKCAVASRNCYAFKVPPSYAAVYRAAGFTVLNSANNHSYDFGRAGELSTTAALTAAGIVEAGLPGQIGYQHVGNVTVAFVDFAPYGLTNNLLSQTQMTSLIATAKRHASFVVVYMHAGAEGETADHVTRRTEIYYGENRGNPYAFAHAAINAGASVVLASGPHVWRGMEWYNGHLIVYSMGDFTNYKAFATVGDLDLTGVVHLSLSNSGIFESGSISPLYFRPGGIAVPDPSHRLWAFVNELSRTDFGANAALISRSGQILAP